MSDENFDITLKKKKKKKSVAFSHEVNEVLEDNTNENVSEKREEDSSMNVDDVEAMFSDLKRKKKKKKKVSSSVVEYV